MNILLTGGTGFIGKHFLQVAQARSDWNVVAIKHRSPPDNFGTSVRWCDIENLDSLEGYHFDAVLHLATTYSRQSDSFAPVALSNVVFPLRVFDMAVAAGCRKLINIDTFYNHPQYNCRFMHSYVRTKKQLRDWGIEYCLRESQLRFYNLRLEHVYGPGDNRDKFLPFIINRMLANPTAIDLTDCTQEWDLVQVEDVIGAFCTIIDALGLKPGFYELGCGTGIAVPLRKVIERCATKIKYRGKLQFGALQQREGEVMHSVAETGLLRSWGWNAAVPWENGIDQLVAYQQRQFFL